MECKGWGKLNRYLRRPRWCTAGSFTELRKLGGEAQESCFRCEHFAVHTLTWHQSGEFYTHTHTHTHTQSLYLQNPFTVFYSLIIICMFTFGLLYVFHSKSNSKDIRDSRTSIFLSFIFLIFYFILEYRWLTMLWQLQASSKRTKAHIHMYPFSLKLPSHPGCHIRLSSVPYVIQ